MKIVCTYMSGSKVTIAAAPSEIADGRTDLVIDILADGYPASTNDADGVSLLQWCAYYGDVSAMKALIADGESLSALGDNFDLNGACFHGHWRLCKFLLEQGATPIGSTLYGRDALACSFMYH